ncbi:MAG: enoyl-CoA hydratase-related protein [Gemmatimonadales bacterium]|nr:enoyl-CoA hydratase-related protein [Gemmatimonadales bacterium]
MSGVGVTASVADGVARLVLDHPPVNILTRDVLACLREELRRLAADRSLRALLLTAAGKHFSAGADVGEHLPPHHAELIPEFLDTVAALDAFPLPVIAAVRGRCLGGGFELVQAADLIVAGEGAVFAQPEITLGVIPPAACALLPALVPAGVAAHLVFTGDSLGAADLQRAGLVWRVTPDAEVETEALRTAERIARHSAAALRLAKEALRSGRTLPRPDAMRRAGRLYLEGVMATADALEGLRAFTERRRPAWSHA